jgi:hypothetical protein
MQVGMTIWNCHQLRRINAVDFKATINFSTMAAKGRNAVLYALRNGWIRSGWHSGTGLLAQRLMAPTGVFFVATRLRKGRNKWNGFQYIDWRWNLETPGWFVERLKPLVEADRTAAEVAGKTHTERYYDGSRYCPFYVLRVQDHLPPLLADYVATSEYRAAVAPLMALVEGGGRIEVNIAPPTGRSWRG